MIEQALDLPQVTPVLQWRHALGIPDVEGSGSPNSSESMISFARTMDGKNVFFSPVITNRPARWPRALRTSTTLAAVGFSIQT